MNPALLALAPALIQGILDAIQVAKLRAQEKAGKPVTPEQVKALFAEYPAKTYDDYLNEARMRQTTLDL
jgi:hypothetical protein